MNSKQRRAFKRVFKDELVRRSAIARMAGDLTLPFRTSAFICQSTVDFWNAQYLNRVAKNPNAARLVVDDEETYFPDVQSLRTSA